MKRTVRVLVGSVVALLACDRGPVAPGNTGQLEVVAVSQASVALDAGKVIVVGPSSNPTTTKRDAAPGQTVKIDGLAPGTYTVALQGFVGGDVAMFGLTSGVQVTAGQNTTATVSFNSFVPAADPLPSSATNNTFTVSYATVAAAMRYQVQAATDQAFTADMVSVDVTPPKTSADITVTKCGTYYARVRAFDPYQSPGRWADAAGSVQVPCPADLVITSATITVTPSSVAPGGTVTLSSYTVANQGAVASNAYRLGYYLSTDATITSADRLLVANSTTALAAGASVTFTGPTLPIPSDVTPGSYFVGPLVDDQNGTPESNEANNFKSTALTVGQADLVISAPATLTVTPPSVAPGGTVTLPSYTVTNQGTAGSNAYRIGYYLSFDTTITTSDMLLLTTSATALAAGASQTLPGPTLTIPVGTTPGRYFVGAFLDDQNGTAESNEVNNFRSTRLTITGPDLVVSGWGVPPVSPTSVPAGGAVTLAGFTVTNQGTVASNAYSIGFYLSVDSTLTTSDVFLSGTLQPALPAGASVTIPGRTLGIPTSTGPRQYFIGPLLDDQNATAESDETNNFKSTALTIVAATIFQATFSNDAVGAAPGAPEIGTWQQAPNAGTITVRQAVGDLTNKPVELNQLNGLTGGVGLYGHVAGSAPTTGSYVASWRSLVHGNAVGASVVVRDNAALIVAAVSISPNGSLRYNNTVLPSVSWVSDNSQLFEIIVDLDARVTSLRINGSAVTGAQNVAFFQSAAANVASLNFETGGTSAQTFAWDDIRVARLTP